MNNPIVRFAPSPTGRLHIGNIRIALYNWMFAQKNGGEFVLRYDDTDLARSKAEYATGILEDLNWLGIEPHRTEKQSARTDSYQVATDKLIADGLLYPCFETADELDRKRSRRRARGLPPIYDRSALNLTSDEIDALKAEGKQPHWRFLLPNFKEDKFSIERTEVHWDDEFRGKQIVDLGSMSDPVLIRGDGSWLYTLPSIVDDAAFGITHVIRGEDHITNTGAQIAIFNALGYDIPTFGHINLLIGAAGEGLSKRLGSLSIQGMREDGLEPMAVNVMATLLGTSESIEPLSAMDALVAKFDPTIISKSPAKFDMNELEGLNSKLLHSLDYSDVADRLDMVPAAEREAFWEAVSGNLSKFADVGVWTKTVFDDLSFDHADEDKEFLQTAKSLLPDGPLDQNSWGIWISSLKESTGRKGKQLFMPLRLALTGLPTGPEMAKLLPLIDRTKIEARLS